MGNFQSVLEEVRALVQDKIKNSEKLPSYMLEKQLYFILDELDKMERIKKYP